LGDIVVNEKSCGEGYICLTRIIKQLTEIRYVRGVTTDNTDSRFVSKCLFRSSLAVGRLYVENTVVSGHVFPTTLPLRTSYHKVRTIPFNTDVMPL
jgi:hypothetical protein